VRSAPTSKNRQALLASSEGLAGRLYEDPAQPPWPPSQVSNVSWPVSLAQGQQGAGRVASGGLSCGFKAPRGARRIRGLRACRAA